MDTQHLNTILIVMVAVYGATVLLNLLMMAGMAIIGGRAMKNLKQQVDEMRASLHPVLQSTLEMMQSTKSLVSKLEPKLEAAAGDLAEIARVAREESTRITASADEITDRIRRQAERVDGMTTSALNGLERAGHFLNQAVNAPARQLSGVIAAARAIIGTLRTPSTPPPPHEAATEEEIREKRRQYI